MSAVPLQPLPPALAAACEDMPRVEETWAEYERRKAAWLADNPGAYPCEIEHAAAVIAQELGL